MSQHGRQNVIHYTLLKLKGDFKRVERNFMKLKERERERGGECVCECVCKREKETERVSEI